MRLIPVSPDYRDGLARFQECQKRPRSRIRRTGLQQHGLLIDGRMQRLGNDPARAALHSDELACGHKSQIGSTCRDKLIGLGNRAAPHDPGRERRIDTKLLQCLDRSYSMKIFLIERLVSVLLEVMRTEAEIGVDLARAPLSLRGADKALGNLVVLDALKGQYIKTK